MHNKVMSAMDMSNATIAQQIGHASSAFEECRTGHRPKSVTVVVGNETLVITLHGALSPAEEALVKSPPGAARIDEFHRQLFATSSEPLREEIKRITGVEVREATMEIEPATGTVVQVFLLADSVTFGTWSGSGRDGQT
jgi:uncharacterized protein YbcI